MAAPRNHASKKKKHAMKRKLQSRFSRVVFLGTSSAQPVPLKRNVSSLMLQTDSGCLSMVDCGEGTQHQLKLSTLKIGKLRNIFITHLHGDHCYGLFGLLHSIRTEAEQQFVLNIYGPKGIKKMIETTLKLSGGLYHYKLNIQELELPQNTDSNQQQPQDPLNGDSVSSTNKKRKLNDHDPAGPPIKRRRVNENDRIWTTSDTIDLGEIEPGIRCTACRLTHRIATFGYVFIEDDQPGTLDAVKAKALGAVGPQLGMLKNGVDVVLENGTTVFSKDVCAAKVSGRKMAVMQDCSDCSSCHQVAAGCDLFIHEATFDEERKDHAIPKGHSTAKMAASNAVSIGAKMLMMTHFSSRFVEAGGCDQNADSEDTHVDTFQKEAEEVVARNGSKCVVRCAADFMSVRFPKKGITIDRELDLKESKKQHFQHDIAYLRKVGT